jgi:hypothetical protein
LRREASATFEIREVHRNFEDEKTGISQSSESGGSSDPELEKGGISDLLMNPVFSSFYYIFKNNPGS